MGWDDSGRWDPADLADLEHCEAFLPNAEEAMRYTRTDCPRAAARKLADRVPLAVVTLGAEGAYAVDGRTGESAEVPAIAVEALDPTGAGDVFVAGFVTGTLADWPLAERLAFAGLSAALSVQEFGGSLSAPGWAEIMRLVAAGARLRGGRAGRAAPPVRLPGRGAARRLPARPAGPRRPDDRLPPPGLSGPAPGRVCPGRPAPAGKALGLVGAPSYSGIPRSRVQVECRQAPLTSKGWGLSRPPSRPMTQTPTQPQARAQFTVPAKHPMVTVLGSGDSLLRVIEKAFPATDIHVRGNEVSAVGDAAEVALVQRLFDEMMLVLRTGQPMTEDAVERSIAMLRAAEDGEGAVSETPAEVLTQNILSNRGRTIRPKTLNQKRYVDAIDEHTVVFGIGPAGTGKTYLAMAKAVQALQAKQVNRIILTRPAVEAA